MGWWERRVVPRIVDKALSGPEIEALRAATCEGLAGEVVEVGFGSGRNVRHYPDAVTRVRAVDPSELGRRMAEPRLARSSVPVELVGLDGESLPVEDDSVDHVLVTWTLCTIGDPDRALTEVRRVLRPGGTLRFVEHGLAPDARLAGRQRRLTPLQRRVCGGCHLDRDVPALLRRNHFDLTELETSFVPGPKPMTHTFRGVAVPA